MLVAPFNLADFVFSEGADEVGVNALAADPAPNTTFPAIFNTQIVNTLAGDDVIRGRISGVLSAQDIVFIGISNTGILEMGDGVVEIGGFVTLSGSLPDPFDAAAIGLSGGGTGLIRSGAQNVLLTGSVELSDDAGLERAFSGAGLADITFLGGAGEDTIKGGLSFENNAALTVSGSAVAGATLVTGLGEDKLRAALTINAPSVVSDGQSLNAIQGSLFSFGAGADVVVANLSIAAESLGAAAQPISFGGISQSTLSFNGGPDRVVVNADVSESSQSPNNEVEIAGLSQSLVSLGRGEDVVDIDLATQGVEAVTVLGIDESVIDGAGGGPKRIKVAIDQMDSGAQEGEIRSLAIHDTSITLGSDHDTVRVDVQTQASGTRASIPQSLGIGQSTLFTGGGDDLVAVSAEATGLGSDGAFGSSFAIAFGMSGGDMGQDPVQVGLGEGDDTLTVDIEATDPDSTFARGISGAVVDLDAGADSPAGGDEVVVNVRAIGGIADAAGIIETDLLGRAGDDTLSVNVLADSTQSSGPNFAFSIGLGGGADNTVTTGRGADTLDIMVKARMADPSGIVIASAIQGGLTPSFVIDTGGGADSVVAQSVVDAPEGTTDITSFGISAAQVFLGSGADTLVARGETAGLSSAFIDGEGGNDVLDVQSGRGTLDGGAGEDTLILEGDRDTFVITREDPGTVRITDAATNGMVTNLEVSNVEIFEFDDGVTALDMILI